MSWLWGCMVLSFEVMIGTLAWAALLIVASILVALAIGGSTVAWPTGPKKPERKLPETWQDWQEEQDGELKTLLKEIDKDLENDTKS